MIFRVLDFDEDDHEHNHSGTLSQNQIQQMKQNHTKENKTAMWQVVAGLAVMIIALFLAVKVHPIFILGAVLIRMFTKAAIDTSQRYKGYAKPTKISGAIELSDYDETRNVSTIEVIGAKTESFRIHGKLKKFDRNKSYRVYYTTFPNCILSYGITDDDSEQHNLDEYEAKYVSL